ncbi:pre-mRNA-splicing regulator WTAP-like [Dysidea avara]|uniref:pre-mRNA-splicing regulator WTAP-like n=1 Tax=Dysidea avara TaxID=196820 RepID=UPI00332A84A5
MDRGKKRNKPVDSAEVPSSSKKKTAIESVNDIPKEKKRIKLTRGDLRSMTRDEIITKWEEQDEYIDWLLAVKGMEELSKLQESESKLTLQVQEATRRENVLNMRLATKQQELQDTMTQVHDLKQAQSPSTAQLHSMLMDPAVNLMFLKMKSELKDVKEKLAQAQSDLSAWKFSTDSATGKRLMTKCRMLLQENQELGKQLSQGKIAQLEAEIALQKKYSQELKTSQDELSEYVFQVDEEAEGLHSSILNSYSTAPTDLTVHNKLGGGVAANKLTSRVNGPLDTPPLLGGVGGNSKSSTSSNETH